MKLKTSIKTQLTFLEADYYYYKCRLPPNQLNEQNKRRIQVGFFFCFVRKGIPLILIKSMFITFINMLQKIYKRLLSLYDLYKLLSVQFSLNDMVTPKSVL